MDTTCALEALRCVANGLLLHAEGRDTWLDLGGGADCLRWLQACRFPIQPRFHLLSSLKRKPRTSEETFVVSRVLFLVTLKPSDFLIEAVQKHKLVESVATVRLHFTCPTHNKTS